MSCIAISFGGGRCYVTERFADFVKQLMMLGVASAKWTATKAIVSPWSDKKFSVLQRIEELKFGNHTLRQVTADIVVRVNGIWSICHEFLKAVFLTDSEHKAPLFKIVVDLFKCTMVGEPALIIRVWNLAGTLFKQPF
jgi:hypothetical protein